MKTSFHLTLAAIVGAILTAGLPAHAAPTAYDSIHTPDHKVSMEIFWMSLKDNGYEFPMVATVNNGVVTLKGPVHAFGQPVPDQGQRDKIDDQIKALSGVRTVNDELNSSAPEKDDLNARQQPASTSVKPS